MTVLVSTAKVRTLFCLAKGLCVFLGFGGRFDGGRQNVCGSVVAFCSFFLAIYLFYLSPCAYLVSFDGLPVFLQTLLVCQCHISLHISPNVFHGLRAFRRFGSKGACQ